MFFISLDAQPTIYIVRHSEKVNDWPDKYHEFLPLSSDGISTSSELREYFNEIKLTAIFCSPTVRTIQTAHPTALDKGIEITINEACSDTSIISTFLKELNENYNDAHSFLIVSHSNIIPYFLIKSGLRNDEYEKMNFTKQGEWWLTDYYGEIFVIKNGERIEREKFSH